MLPQDCPIFQTCSAPICPLDPRWPTAYHINGEPVCRYLLASGKQGAAEHYRNDPTFQACLTQLGPVCEAYPCIAKDVAEASRRGFRKPPPRKHSQGSCNEAATGDEARTPA
jgi:hypothetical protein